MTTWRQRFIRFLGWWIAACASFVAVILLVFAVYLLFFDYPEMLREKLEVELSEIAGAPAHIGSINLDIASYAFELTDVSVGGSGADSETERAESILTLDRVWGRLRLSEIVRLRLHWTELVVQGLSVRLVEGSEGGLAFPRDVRATPVLAGAGVAFSADRISLEDAVFVLSNENVPWQLEASNLGLELTRDRSHSYKGTLSYDDGVLIIKDHARIEGSLTAEIELSAGELFVHEARGESEFGTVTARGKLGLGGGLSGRFDVEAEGDLERVANLLGLELDEGALTGVAHFEGSLAVTPDNRKLEGTLQWPAGRLHGVPMRDWTGDVFWDRQLLQVSLAQGQLASGRARVSLHQAFPMADHAAVLDLDVTGASLSEILSGLSSRSSLSNLSISSGRLSRLASNVSGRASLFFPAASPEIIDGTFEVMGTIPVGLGSFSEVADADMEGVAFVASGRLRGGDIELTSAEVEMATLTGTMTGLYPREGSAELLVDIHSVDLARTNELARDLRRLFRTADEPAPEAWGIAGRGRARGRLTERLPHLRFEGALEAPELRFDRLRVDDVEVRAVLSRGALSFEDLLGHRNDGVVAGSGSLSFEGPMGSRDFDLELRFSEWPARDLATLLDSAATAEGLTTGHLAVRRSSGELDGVAELAVSRPVLLGASFDRAEVRAIFAGKKVELEQVSIFRGDSRMEGALELDIQTGAVQGELSTREFPLDGSDVFGFELTGWLDAEAALAGHVDAPVVDLTLKARSLNLDGADVGDATIAATMVNEGFELDVRLGDTLVVEASGRLRGDVPVSGTLRFVELDAGPWFARVSESFSQTTRVLTTGNARFTAELRRASSLGIDATLTQVVVQSDRVHLESLAPVKARYQDGILHMPSLTLAEGSSRVALGGTVNFLARSLDLRLEGVTELDIVETFYPSLAATGSVDLSARVTGSWDAPSLSGRADLDGSSLRIEGFPQALGGLRGRLVFDNRTIRIPELHAVFGSGPVSISGAVSLAGLSAGSIDLIATGTGMRLRYPEGLVAMLDADLALLGSRDEQVLSGQITLTDAVWTRDYDLVAGILTDSEGVGLFDEFAEDELFENLRFDVSIVAPESLRLKNSIAEIDASAELELRGSLAQPVLLGTTVAHRGEVYFLGQRYDITAGKIDFVDPTAVQPFIELTAETRVRSYRVELRLTGTIDRLYPELSSDPPLRTVDILRLLSGASERDILIGTEEEELAGVGVASLLTERLSQELGRRASRLFGLDRVSIDPFLVGQIANPTARVSLGKQITRDLSINYSTNLNATTEAIILIEYTPEGNMSWILSRDEEGDVGIDVKFRKSF